MLLNRLQVSVVPYNAIVALLCGYSVDVVALAGLKRDM